MLGLILTVVAVLLGICFAFCFSDTRYSSDALFYVAPKSPSKAPGCCSPRDSKNTTPP